MGEKEETLEVLSDLLHEKGKSAVLKNQKFLFDCVLSAAASDHSPGKGVKRDCGCSDRSYPRPSEIDRHHDPRCRYGEFLRLLGSPDVAVRQMNASHEQALMANSEEMRLKQLGSALLELPTGDNWVKTSTYSSEVLEALKLRDLIQIRSGPRGETQTRVAPGVKIPTSVHASMKLVRATRAHKQCWDCDSYSHGDEEAPGHCTHCQQDWPPEGPCQD